jgi:hypothetical protein
VSSPIKNNTPSFIQSLLEREEFQDEIENDETNNNPPSQIGDILKNPQMQQVFNTGNSISFNETQQSQKAQQRLETNTQVKKLEKIHKDFQNQSIQENVKNIDKNQVIEKFDKIQKRR